MATVNIDVQSQIQVLTRTELQGLITGSLLTAKMIYIVSNAAGGSKRIALMALTANTLSGAATNLTDAQFGTYNISTDVFTATAGGGGVQSVTGDSVDNTDPLNPIVNAIPRAGTDGNEVTGDLQVGAIKYFYEDNDNYYYIVPNVGFGWVIHVQKKVDDFVMTFDMRTGKIAVTSSDPNFQGLNYGANYFNNFDLRSLIDLAVLKSRFWVKAGAPTLTDDINAGFVEGSLIFNTDNNTWYKCTSNTVGAAAWTALSSGGVSDGDKGDVTVSSGGTAWAVTRLQGRAVNSTAPTAGQTLVWDGTQWLPSAPSAVGCLYQLSNTNGDTVAAGTTYYALTNPVTDSTTQNARFTLMTHNGQIVRMRVLTISAQPSTLTTVITLQVNGVDTAMTVTIAPSTAAGTFTMSGAPVSFNNGGTIGLKVVSTGTGTSAIFGAMSTLIRNTENI